MKFIETVVNEVVNVKGIERNKIVLFLDNAAAHTSNYALWNFYN